jgi:hypothetical protein
VEAPPGIEPGMEVLQGHPRSFRLDPHFASLPRKSHLVNQMRRFPEKRLSSVALAEIGGLEVVAGTVRAQLGGRYKNFDVLDERPRLR